MLTGLTKSLSELWTSRDLMGSLIERELKIRYRRSAFGFLWSLITPIYQIVIFTFILHMMGVKDSNLSIKILVGIIPWTFFSVTLLSSCAAILRFRNVVKKIYFPRQLLVLSTVAANLVHLLLSILVMFGIFLVLPVAFRFSFWFLIPLVVLETVLVSGLSLIVCTAHTFFGDVEYLLTNLMQVAMFLVPVLYPLTKIDQYGPLWATIYRLNPIAILIAGWRQVLLPEPGASLYPDPFWMGLAAVSSMLVFIIGLAMWQRHEWRFPEVI